MKFLGLVLSALLASSPLIAGAKLKLHKMTGVPGQYMVVLLRAETPNDVPKLAKELAKRYKLEIGVTWDNAIDGFVCRGTDESIRELAEDPLVDFVEQDLVISSPRVAGTQWASWNGHYLWHLDRIDEVSWAVENRDGKHNMCTEGRDSVAYVIDMGVKTDHPQFETPSRVVMAIDFSDDRTNLSEEWTYDNTNGCDAYQNRWHGTAVASVLGGTQVGVAKPQIVSLKAAQCSTREFRGSWLISAVNWIGRADRLGDPYRSRPGVINHSGFVPPWDADFLTYKTVVKASVLKHQKPFFTSADNYSTDACLFAPADGLARTNSGPDGEVFVVGGSMVTGNTDSRDFRWQEYVNGYPAIGPESGSNAGACVSIYAPAKDIYAARTVAGGDYGWASGTSFASPIVAGIAARYIEKQKNLTGVIPTYSQVYSWLLGNAAAPLYDALTPSYYLCAEGLASNTFIGSCPSGTFGRDYSGNWGLTFPSAFLQNVGNDSGARMVYWDEGPCDVDWTMNP